MSEQSGGFAHVSIPRHATTGKFALGAISRPITAPGIWSILTASHGALLDARQDAMPDVLRLDENAYEEDADWCLVYGFRRRTAQQKPHCGLPAARAGHRPVLALRPVHGAYQRNRRAQ